MNKKLMALAVAGALAPAAALAQNYSIYGRATLGVDSYEAKGATLLDAAGTANPNGDYKRRARVFDNGSRVGFRGTEDLGGGVQAVFLIETGVNIDNGSTTGQSGGANTSTGTWGSRIGHVGLSGSAGMVTWGRSNIFWTNGTQEQIGANWINSGPQNTTGTFGRGMGVGITRQSNTMQYTSPTWSGVNFVASFSPNRAEAQAPTGTNTGGPGDTTAPSSANTDGKVIGLTVQGTHGPFAWGVDFVSDKGNKPDASATAPDQGENIGLKLRAGYKYVPAGQIALIFVQSQVKAGGSGNSAASATALPAVCNTAATNCDFKQAGLTVAWDHMFGPWHPILAVSSVGDMEGSGCSSTATGIAGGAPAGQQCEKTSSTQITAAVRYVFSKRTHAYLSYNKIDNDTRANLDNTGASITARGTAFTGADPTIIAAGVIHNF